MYQKILPIGNSVHRLATEAMSEATGVPPRAGEYRTILLEK
jgi:hypothetical protein